MSRIAEASACAGRAVPDNSPVDWAKEREAAETLLSGPTPEKAAHPSPIPVPSPRAVDPIDQTAPWPPKFDLDDIDLSHDSHALSFRRVATTRRASHDHRRAEFDDATPRGDSNLRDQLFSTDRILFESDLTEKHRVTRRWVIVAVALIILLAAAALLTYVLWNRPVGVTQQNVDSSVRFSPIYVAPGGRPGDTT
jgi:hypothetical protein